MVSVVDLFQNETIEGLINKEILNDTLISYVVNIAHRQIDRICELVIECQQKLLWKNLKDDLNQGFLIFSWSLNHLKELLSSNESFLICVVDQKNNKLAGYLLLTSVNHLTEHISSEDGQFTLDETAITHEQWTHFISSPKIHYIEQTGVNPNYYRLGIGTHLISIAKKLSTEGLCTCVTFWPYSNDASTKLIVKNGFTPVASWHQFTCSEFSSFKSTVFVWFQVHRYDKVVILKNKVHNKR